LKALNIHGLIPLSTHRSTYNRPYGWNRPNGKAQCSLFTYTRVYLYQHTPVYIEQVNKLAHAQTIDNVIQVITRQNYV